MLNRRCATGLITAIAPAGEPWPPTPRATLPSPSAGWCPTLRAVARTLARTIGQQLSQQISQPVTVDNKPGGNTAIAASEVARSAADGYTILSADNGTMVFNTALYSKLTYNPEKDPPPSR